MCIQFNGNTSESLKVRSSIKQGCIVASTLFAIYFAAPIQHAFDGNEDGIYLTTRFNGCLFSLETLKSK